MLGRTNASSNSSSGAAPAKSRENIKLRDSCEICAAAKVRCSKEKPACTRCINRGLKCQYGLSRRNGRSATNSNNSNRTTFDQQSQGSHGMRNFKSVDTQMEPDCSFQNRLDAWMQSISASEDRLHMLDHASSTRQSQPSFSPSMQAPTGFAQDMSHLNMHTATHDADMTMFMMDNDLTPWSGVPQSWGTAGGEADHCCLHTALDLFKQLSVTEASEACSRRGMMAQMPPPLTMEMAASMNRSIIVSLKTILDCSCALNANLLTIISLIIFKLIAWCAAAARITPRADSPMVMGDTTSNAPIALKDVLRSPAADLDGLMDALSGMGNEQIQATAQTVLDDLYRVQDLVNTLSYRLAMARNKSTMGGNGVGSSSQATMCNTSTMLTESFCAQLEADLRGRLRAVSYETVQLSLQA